jgi:dTDP-4-dehydrorhamnose 3,5-epimerase
MSRFVFQPTGISGLVLVERSAHVDARGSFGRLFCAEELRPSGWSDPVSQSNVSHTLGRGTLRGMHYQQPPFAEMKYVSCIKGAIFDVAVDVRKGSPTFLQWRGFELSAENRKSLVIPEGFAHGFQCLSEDCLMIYFHSAAHAAGHDAGLDALDPQLSIDWPLPVANRSQRDQGFTRIDHAFGGV